MPEISVRPATSADAAVIAAIHSQARDGQHSPSRADRRAELWTRWLADPERNTVCAEVAGEPVGFLSTAALVDTELSPEPLLELVALYVKPTFWDVGVGSRLYEVFLAALRDTELSSAALQLWDHNERASRFYQRRGWRPDGWSRPGASGSRFVRMRLQHAGRADATPADLGLDASSMP